MASNSDVPSKNPESLRVPPGPFPSFRRGVVHPGVLGSEYDASHHEDGLFELHPTATHQATRCAKPGRAPRTPCAPRWPVLQGAPRPSGWRRSRRRSKRDELGLAEQFPHRGVSSTWNIVMFGWNCTGREWHGHGPTTGSLSIGKSSNPKRVWKMEVLMR